MQDRQSVEQRKKSREYDEHMMRLVSGQLTGNEWPGLLTEGVANRRTVFLNPLAARREVNMANGFHVLGRKKKKKEDGNAVLRAGLAIEKATWTGCDGAWVDGWEGTRLGLACVCSGGVGVEVMTLLRSVKWVSVGPSTGSVLPRLCYTPAPCCTTQFPKGVPGYLGPVKWRMAVSVSVFRPLKSPSTT